MIIFDMRIDSFLNIIAMGDLDTSGLNSWGAREWSKLAAAMSKLSLRIGMFAPELYERWRATVAARQYLLALDVNSDSDVDIVDIIATWNWMLELGSGDGDNLPTSSDIRIKYPKFCCDEDDDVAKETPETERENPGCSAEIEILNVMCRPESMNTKRKTEQAIGLQPHRLLFLQNHGC